MSKILKGLTEAKITDYGPGDEETWPPYAGHPNDPRAGNYPRKKIRTEPDDFEQDDSQDEYYKKSKVHSKYINKEGVASNGKKYNTVLYIQAQDPYQIDSEIRKFKNMHWGAKEIVDIDKTNDNTASVFIVDNHKHGYWTPWKDEPPISKGFEFEENTEKFINVLEGISQEDLANVLYYRFKKMYPDIFMKFNSDTLQDAINDVASVFVGVDELGSSDVNIMIRELIKNLKDKTVDENMVMGVSSDASSAGSKVQGENAELEENLRKWFKEKWVRFGPDGKIRGACARGDDSEGKPKCLPQSKAHSLGKKGRKYAAAKKRREDPNPERSGKAINVATKKKTNEEQIDELKCWPGYTRVRGVPAGAPGSCKKKTSEDQAPMFTPESKCPHCGGVLVEFSMINEKKDACYYKVKSRYKVWPSAYASGALVKCRKRGAKNWGNKSESVELNELSTEKLAQYKKAAGIDAKKADNENDFEKGNKRFRGIVKATKKQFDNETKNKKESAIMKGIVDETLGTPYPGTYEQETKPFMRKGQERTMKIAFEGKE